MDKEQLKRGLKPFFDKCKTEGYAITEFRLESAFPGVHGSPWTLRVGAPWIKDMEVHQVLYLLFEYLNESTEEDVNYSIITIAVFDEYETHSYGSSIPEALEARDIDEPYRKTP